MSKTIKNIYKILLIVLLVILILPATGYFLVRNQNVQNYIVQQLSDAFSKKLDAHFEVKSAYYTPFNKLVLEDVYLEDQSGDSLLYSKNLTGRLKFLGLKNRELFFKKLSMNSATIHIRNDTAKNINIKFLIEALKRKDTTKPKMHIQCNNLEINNSKITYKTNLPSKNDYGIDFNDLTLYNFDIEAQNLNIDSGKIYVDFQNLSFTEKSGMRVLDLQSKIRLNKNKLSLKELAMRTPSSFFQTDSVVLHHNHYKNFKNPLNKLRLDVNLGESNLAFNDLAYFSDIFQDIPNQNFVISGDIDGTVSNLKGDSIFLGTGRQSEILTDFSLTGLPDISKTFMYVDVKHLYTGIQDLGLINNLLGDKGHIDIPEIFQNMGRIRYRGNFTGFIDDFVAYGKFNTQLGEFSTDLLIRPKKTRGLALEGNLKTQNFNIGRILENKEHFGNMSMDIQVQGSIFPDKGFQAQTNGTINELEINRYNYQNIKLNGFLTEKMYDGALSIEDPNIKFNFQGGIDFTSDVPVFDFNADLEKARLNKLNLVEKDTSAQLSFSLMSNFRGDNLDNASGVITMNHGELIKNNQKLNFENLHIQAKHRSDTHRIKLTSDHINAELVGQYQSTTVYQSLKNMALSYMPVFINKKEDTTAVKAKSDFELNINLNNTKKITDIFFPGYSIHDSSKVKLKYNGNKKSFHLTAESKSFNYKNYNLQNIKMSSRSQDSIFSLVFRFNKLQTLTGKETSYFHDFELKSLTGNNKSKLVINWNDLEDHSNKGEIVALLNMDRSKATNNIRTNIYFLPSNIKLQNNTWQLSQSSITIDTTSISFNDLNFYHKNQRMAIDGQITKDKQDTLQVEFSDIHLEYANLFFPKGNIEFNGIINGKAKFADLYDAPTFHSDFTIDTLVFNNSKIGNTRITSKWINNKEEIGVSILSKRGDLKTLDINGKYVPSNQSLQFGINLDKVSMAALNPILQKSFSDFSGALSGYLNLSGTLNKPIFNGKLFSHKSSFLIDYLQTRYHFTSNLDVTDNRINFDSLSVTDDAGHQAQVTGQLHFHSFKNIDYNFNINANKFKSLNTSGFDNNIYYGEAFTSGPVSIQGNTQTKNLNIDASLKTENNTLINLPIGQKGNSEKTGFLTFVNDNNKDNQETEQESLNRNLSDLDLDFDLEATPQAQTRLILDPDFGDLIEARGRGNLNMEVNNNGNFRIYGDYIIEEGTYRFSLKNMINKKFEIQQGSQIVWNGEPKDADIDITAVYSLRTSLNNLFMDTTEYYNKPIPVDCKIQLTNKLVNPTINFEIDLPTADESTIARVKGAINTEEELNKQFLSLLVLNTFMPAQQYLAGQPESFNMGASSIAFITSELLSNQLSQWLSKISSNWDIGVNYQPGDEISKDQVEVALSTQLLNDRLIINGNVGTSDKYHQSSEFVGDFRVDWKLTPNGKLRLKFFNRNSDRLIYEETRYIQGAGLFYREEFDSFKELFKDIAEKLSFKEKKEKEKKN
ncbi:MAG: translocation/assembly module TamB domain-containing protein [Bacteroidales bacterium]|nr:translocation/assembly module TamB domain-containing protein [Bacteroidales bacterium]